MIFEAPLPSADPARQRVREAFLADEGATVRSLADAAGLDDSARAAVREDAMRLVAEVRSRRAPALGIETLLQEYELSTAEGIALMCLAEALLRIPDAETANRLIRDKLAHADWGKHVGHSSSVLVNAATWGLALTGRLLREEDLSSAGLSAALLRVVARQSEPIMREAMEAAMRIMGRQFVMGRTIDEALRRAGEGDGREWRYSFDMLGEAARTAVDAARYLESYHQAIETIGRAAANRGPIEGNGISIKLSALHPRYEFGQRCRAMKELVPRLLGLAEAARKWKIGLTVDAEEADRLDLSLDVIAAVFGHSRLNDWDGFGLAVQGYQKRALPLIDWLIDLARSRKRRLMVRLVKGAYWDAEIKRGQERGLSGYPVFTRKSWTDLSYLACARRLLAAPDAIYPQLATHNAHTLAAAHRLAGANAAFEFQRLHGMGEALHRVAGELLRPKRPCRVYCPVGSHEDLLPYLVRRLLENGANTSFVHKVSDPRTPMAKVVEDPYDALAARGATPHPKIPLPRDIYGTRPNSAGIDMSDVPALAELAQTMKEARGQAWSAAPVVNGQRLAGPAQTRREPAHRERRLGEVIDATPTQADAALAAASSSQPAWDARGAKLRAVALDRAADLFEAHRAALMARIVAEGGRTVPNALGEVREAIDFLRFYAAEARRVLASSEMPGPTGERNTLRLHGRGVFVCISPWNFPLAIFTGQIAAALVAGNTVIAKPAEQTPLVAAEAVRLLHEAGIDAAALHLLPGGGEIGAHLVRDPRVCGVAFTGSTQTAWAINRALAARDSPIAALVAETGGQNAMIVDSSALPEQVVADALASAFDSTGQRCSALRVLCVQEDIADKVETMLAGALDELRIGDPQYLATDVGPVIDAEARAMLEDHIARLRREARVIRDGALPKDLPPGEYVAPAAFGIDAIAFLKGEVFGPVLHVVRYAADRVDAVVDAINATGYGLTLGIHSRIDETIERIVARVRAGNIYVNRNMIGAAVGVQPFGGEGLSGTGPKAGGPHYLQRFVGERTFSINTAAAGGNATLVSLDES
jgi:RHH-type proline utilization regulon transcriptional repressor/proline dehydrogenase/delta 1-pyrroline-5-carboxylate dehydrogenase